MKFEILCEIQEVGRSRYTWFQWQTASKGVDKNRR